MKRIFQIGFNKSGTGSIHNFMLKNDIPSIHWGGGKLSKAICKNYSNSEPLLNGFDDFLAFSDMEHVKEEGGYFYSAEHFFKELDVQYPGSIFILNYRDCESWISSRFNHGGYVLHSCREKGEDVDTVVKSWRDEYFRHIDNVKSYFGESERLFEMDLDKMDSSDLGDFLKYHGFCIKEPEFPHTHKTKKKSAEDYVDTLRNAAIDIEKYDIQLALEVMLSAQKIKNGGMVKNRVEWYRQVLSKRR